MDYDGANQHSITHLGSISLSPRISPDNSRIAFASLGSEGWSIRMFSLDLNRMVSFRAGAAGGSNQSPAWSADGSKIAFSSARSGHPEIWAADVGGGNLRQITSFGSDVSPCWNPRTGGQLAFVSGRTGEPQIYIMDKDGANVQRMTDGGYAISPSWAPNGGLLAFSWNRKYGPGDPGRAGHLRNGHRQQALAAGHARGRQQRFSIVVAGWSAHRVPAPDRAPHGDLDDAGRWHRDSISSHIPATIRCRTGAGSDERHKNFAHQHVSMAASVAGRQSSMILWVPECGGGMRDD